MKVKNRIVVWVQDGGKWIGYLPSWSLGWPGVVAAAAVQYQERVPGQESLAQENWKYIPFVHKVKNHTIVS